MLIEQPDKCTGVPRTGQSAAEKQSVKLADDRRSVHWSCRTWNICFAQDFCTHGKKYLLLPLVKNGNVYISAWCEVNRKTGRVVYVHRDEDDSSTYSFSAQTLTENPKKETKWVTNTQQQWRDTQYKKKHEASFPFFSVLSTYRLWTRGVGPASRRSAGCSVISEKTSGIDQIWHWDSRQRRC